MRHGTTLGPLKNLFLLGNFLLKNRFCHFFLNYRGALEGRVRDNKYRRSPIPKGGLEISIVLIVNKDKTPSSVFDRMKEYLQDYYQRRWYLLTKLKPRRDWPLMIWTNMALRRRTLWKWKKNHPSDIGEGNIIVIEDKWILF